MGNTSSTPPNRVGRLGARSCRHAKHLCRRLLDPLGGTVTAGRTRAAGVAVGPSDGYEPLVRARTALMTPALGPDDPR